MGYQSTEMEGSVKNNLNLQCCLHLLLILNPLFLSPFLSIFIKVLLQFTLLAVFEKNMYINHYHTMLGKQMLFENNNGNKFNLHLKKGSYRKAMSQKFQKVSHSLTKNTCFSYKISKVLHI